MYLPAPTENQAFCTISALEGGRLIVPEALFITDPTPDLRLTMPSLCFLLQHSNKPEKFLFDMGIRSDWENFPPRVQKSLKNPAVTVEISPESDCKSSLARGGTKPEDIDFVCLSHVHWDHTGNPDLFTNSTFIVGEECRSLLSLGYPKDPEAWFPADLLPPLRTRYLDMASTKGLGPFPHALDFYGDGSLFIIDSPGHLAGHINILARTSPDGAWIYLAGDSAHHWKILTGESQIKVGALGDPTFCIHASKDEAEKHIAHIREISKLPRVRVLLAHDIPWYKDNRDGTVFWPGQIPSL